MTRVALDVSAVPARPAGAGMYILELVRALGDAGTALELVSTRRDRARWAALAPAATVHPVVPSPRPARLAWEQVRAATLARRVGATVWHGPHYTMPVRLPVPAVVTVHDMTFFDHPEWHERSKVLFFRRLIRMSAARAHALVCVSEHTASRLRDLLEPAAPVSVIPHGVDHGRFGPDADADADVAALDAAGIRRPYVAFLGTLEPRKDVPSLVRAFDRVAAAHPDLSLVLAGQRGWGTSAVDDAVAAARHARRIVRAGYVPDPLVPALLRQAAAVSYPSLEEGFGLPALEALACGAPLVTTRGSAMEEVAGEAAVLVPPGDDEALAGAIDRVLADTGLRASLRAAGPRVAAAYTWERCAAEHAAVYEDARP